VKTLEEQVPKLYESLQKKGVLNGMNLASAEVPKCHVPLTPTYPNPNRFTLFVSTSLEHGEDPKSPEVDVPTASSTLYTSYTSKSNPLNPLGGDTGAHANLDLGTVITGKGAVISCSKQ
ncbi:unnamed protein product, partial [marine sediment metagenome]